ncbi:MAG TPA: hypothetical protein VF285_11210 [Castellaniella sp.]|uniref:hypothetical protein n=1 Tax=Castellaniella sp. TaxID=1955812 RepID=UPI002F0D0A57
MQRALDFDKTPPLAVPLPFFLNVPLFALLAGALASWMGPEIFASRWSPASLALTHLWTLGILGSAMLGALLQILTVACNVRATPTRPIAHSVHAALTAGTLLLAAGFLWQWSRGWKAAVLLLAIAFGTYLVALAHALWAQRQSVYAGAREILVPVRGALLALALTAVIGLTLASLRSQGVPAPARWVDGHALWGLLGWGGLLLMGMSFQLLPIFQVTELYPAWLTRFAPWGIVVLLVAWSAAAILKPAGAHLGHVAAVTLLAMVYLIWAAVTWQRLHTRKRPTPESTTLFWYASLASLVCCGVLGMMAEGPSTQPAYTAGILFVVGVLGSAVNGMLYKIIPFLLWTHAQAAIVLPPGQMALGRRIAKALPKMADYIPERHARMQWGAHVLVVLTWALAALGVNLATWLAGPCLLMSAAGLTWNLAQALRQYRRALHRLAAVLPK